MYDHSINLVEGNAYLLAEFAAQLLQGLFLLLADAFQLPIFIMHPVELLD